MAHGAWCVLWVQRQAPRLAKHCVQQTQLAMHTRGTINTTVNNTSSTVSVELTDVTKATRSNIIFRDTMQQLHQSAQAPRHRHTPASYNNVANLTSTTNRVSYSVLYCPSCPVLLCVCSVLMGVVWKLWVFIKKGATLVLHCVLEIVDLLAHFTLTMQRFTNFFVDDVPVCIAPKVPPPGRLRHQHHQHHHPTCTLQTLKDRCQSSPVCS